MCCLIYYLLYQYVQLNSEWLIPETNVSTTTAVPSFASKLTSPKYERYPTASALKWACSNSSETTSELSIVNGAFHCPSPPSISNTWSLDKPGAIITLSTEPI